MKKKDTLSKDGYGSTCNNHPETCGNPNCTQHN